MRNVALPFCAARLRRSERGVQFMEVALALPVLLILLLATAEFGRYFFVYATLSRASRTAVRHVASNAFRGVENREHSAAINLALCGAAAGCSGGSEILRGLTADHFQITAQGGTRFFPATVTVTVNYSYTPLFDLGKVADVSWSRVTLTPSTTMRYSLTN